jgi:peptidyl-prolyl cis-trans isomerase SurA
MLRLRPRAGLALLSALLLNLPGLLELGAPRLCQPLHAQEVLDGLAAVVDDKVITFSQVRELIGSKERSIRERIQGKDQEKVLKEIRMEAINELIDRQLILAYFKKQGYNLPPFVLEDRVATIIREDHNGDRGAFARKLASFGYTIERFRKEEMDKIIVQSMRQQAVKTSPSIPAEKIRAFYNAHVADFTTEEQVQLRMIILRSEEKGSLETRQKLAEEIREKIKAGATFEEMARAYSDDNTASSGGDWGWIKADTLNEALSKPAMKLKPGKTSSPITLGDSVYLLYCEARKTRAVQTFEEARDTIEKVLLSQERQKAQEEWLAKLRQKAYIKIF